MAEYTTVEDDSIIIGDKEFTYELLTLVRNYKFLHQNNLPKSIVVPKIDEVEGVPIVYPATKVKKPKKVADDPESD